MYEEGFEVKVENGDIYRLPGMVMPYRGNQDYYLVASDEFPSIDINELRDFIEFLNIDDVYVSDREITYSDNKVVTRQAVCMDNLEDVERVIEELDSYGILVSENELAGNIMVTDNGKTCKIEKDFADYHIVAASVGGERDDLMREIVENIYGVTGIRFEVNGTKVLAKFEESLKEAFCEAVAIISTVSKGISSSQGNVVEIMDAGMFEILKNIKSLSKESGEFSKDENNETEIRDIIKVSCEESYLAPIIRIMQGMFSNSKWFQLYNSSEICTIFDENIWQRLHDIGRKLNLIFPEAIVDEANHDGITDDVEVSKDWRIGEEGRCYFSKN